MEVIAAPPWPESSQCGAPGQSPGYIFGLNSASAAPVGSIITLNHPTVGISVTSFITVAPSDLAFAVATLMSSTMTYANQAEGAPGTGCFIIPPPVPSPTLIMV